MYKYCDCVIIYVYKYCGFVWLFMTTYHSFITYIIFIIISDNSR